MLSRTLKMFYSTILTQTACDNNRALNFVNLFTVFNKYLIKKGYIAFQLVVAIPPLDM